MMLYRGPIRRPDPIEKLSEPEQRAVKLMFPTGYVYSVDASYIWVSQPNGTRGIKVDRRDLMHPVWNFSARPVAAARAWLGARGIIARNTLIRAGWPAAHAARAATDIRAVVHVDEHRAVVRKNDGEITVMNRGWVFELGEAVRETRVAYGVIAIPIDE